MKRSYTKPVMFMEEFISEQYVAASTCGISVGTPPHGHFQNRAGETHCAFTSSNCGDNATTCLNCSSFDPSKHQVITSESGSVIKKPDKSYHNCHVLSTNEAAQSFVDTYGDENCGAGVAALMKVNGFDDIAQAFS